MKIAADVRLRVEREAGMEQEVAYLIISEIIV